MKFGEMLAVKIMEIDRQHTLEGYKFDQFEGSLIKGTERPKPWIERPTCMQDLG